MTDNGHTDHEQLGRRLHEQGQAQAPPGLAGDVMRQVRAEPRRRPQRAWLRPVALCAAVAVLLAASIAGLARIGGSGQSSSAGSAAETHSAAKAGAAGAGNLQRQAANPDAVIPERQVAGVPAEKLATLSPLPFCTAQAHTYALRVPAGRYGAVRRQLRTWAAKTPTGATTYNVQIRRAPASARLALTCP